MTQKEYFQRPNNMAFHDLTKLIKLPPFCKRLLGLGFKFIPQRSRVDPMEYAATIKRLRHDVRVKYMLSKEQLTDSQCPKLYLRDPTYIPNRANDDT